VWEDEQCKSGGKWAIKIGKQYTNKYWEDLILALIGDQFEDQGEVLGLVANLRKEFDTIQIWNRSGTDQTKIAQLKKDLERILDLKEDMVLEYECFAEELAKYEARKTEGSEFKKSQPPAGEGFRARGGRGRGTA
jgi:translation initiation factor 4E